MSSGESAASTAEPSGSGSASPALPVLRRLIGGGASVLVAGLAHVLQQNDWARVRLAPFAGRVVRVGVDAPGLPGLPFDRPVPAQRAWHFPPLRISSVEHNPGRWLA